MNVGKEILVALTSYGVFNGGSNCRVVRVAIQMKANKQFFSAVSYIIHISPLFYLGFTRVAQSCIANFSEKEKTKNK